MSNLYESASNLGFHQHVTLTPSTTAQDYGYGTNGFDLVLGIGSGTYDFNGVGPDNLNLYLTGTGFAAPTGLGAPNTPGPIDVHSTDLSFADVDVSADAALSAGIQDAFNELATADVSFADGVTLDQSVFDVDFSPSVYEFSAPTDGIPPEIQELFDSGALASGGASSKIGGKFGLTAWNRVAYIDWLLEQKLQHVPLFPMNIENDPAGKVSYVTGEDRIPDLLLAMRQVEILGPGSNVAISQRGIRAELDRNPWLVYAFENAAAEIGTIYIFDPDAPLRGIKTF